MKNILKYAANPMKEYVGYGSINNGLEVIAYRSKMKQQYIKDGHSIEEAYIMACKAVEEKYGLPI